MWQGPKSTVFSKFYPAVDGDGNFQEWADVYNPRALITDAINLLPPPDSLSEAGFRAGVTPEGR